MTVLNLQEILSTLKLLHHEFTEETHPLQSHKLLVEIEAQREVGVRGSRFKKSPWLMAAFISVE